MQKVYGELDNFVIESCKIKATIKSCFELVKYDLLFTLKKLNNGSNIWEINSPIQGFTFIEAKDMNGSDIKSDSEVNNGIKKVKLDLTNLIAGNNKLSFKVSYESKLISELLKNKLFAKEYGIIFIRNFGSYCQLYLLELNFENKWYTCKNTIPNYSYPKKKKFEFTEIPTQKPIAVAIITNLKIRKFGVGVVFVVTALAGYYIPKIVDWVIGKVF